MIFLLQRINLNKILENRCTKVRIRTGRTTIRKKQQQKSLKQWLFDDLLIYSLILKDQRIIFEQNC